jgi:hypothetical protein
MRVAFQQGDRANIPDQCAESLAKRLRAVTRLNVAFCGAHREAALFAPPPNVGGTLARVGPRAPGRRRSRHNGPGPSRHALRVNAALVALHRASGDPGGATQINYGGLAAPPLGVARARSGPRGMSRSGTYAERSETVSLAWQIAGGFGFSCI